jgi:hypothetical protein
MNPFVKYEVGHKLIFIKKDQTRLHDIPCGVFRGKSDTETGFFPKTCFLLSVISQIILRIQINWTAIYAMELI